MSVAIREAIENAVKYAEAEPTISISVTIDDDGEQAFVDVEDDGPGIPEHELEVMHSGGETPLAHGSGIGLWVIHWMINSLGGELTIRNAEPTGTIISMAVPLETEQDLPELRH